MRDIDQIIIHCSDTYAKMDVGAAEIRRWHTDPKPDGRGWDDIGYHYVIRRNGVVENGRDLDGDGDVLEEVGAHALGYNARSIGICMVGGRALSGRAEFNFTFDQMVAAEKLVLRLREMFPGVEVIGHRDVSSKDCPAFDAKTYFNRRR